MAIDDPQVQAGVFGVALPAFSGAIGAGLGWLIAGRRDKKLAEAGSSFDEDMKQSPRADALLALGLGGAFAVASLGLVGVPDTWPRAMSEWMLPIVAAGTVAAIVPGLIGRGLPSAVVRWLLRAGFVAGLLAWPLANTRSNHWEGAEAAAWMAGVAAWLLLSFAAMDRVATRLPRAMVCVVLGLSVAGLIPVVFGAGVTAQPQVSGGLAAGIGVAGVVALISRGIVPLVGAGGVVVAWLASTMFVGWPFVADMAWWEVGLSASLPVLAALPTLVPGLSKRRAAAGWIAVALVAGATAGVSARHVPDLVSELTGSGQGSDLDDLYEMYGS
ncbi:MAG: hypothetical protein AAGH71_00270 [Planctomycetota bacterium]